MKIVLITGANKGIGLETAKQLSKKGLFVYLGSRDIGKGEAIVKELKEKGFENVRAIEIDVTQPDTILSAKNTVEKEQGHLDILINNAGISGIVPQSALESSIDSFKEVYETNVYGVVRVTQAFIDLLGKSSEPRIVNVSTSVGSLSLQSSPDWPPYDYAKMVVYGSSKAAANMYTVHLAYELRDTAFKINAVCPGYTKTDFTNQNGGDVEEAAKRIIKYALIDQDGPTGKFFSEESNPETGEIPW
ncbi:NAD(P)-dependent dehydrogenase (short-subunit alcohol dehydrogenase family) [Pedobacter psychrotolerans]|uniref:NAD(P)-dependent dehydrogenase (Short-subunit alcohol dehydrogenase family) n=1 Tax=Pedobacter psychrotolerans TaxID=1843235 RepID=A0A4R2HD41_9SPHI|nr:SDR family oxidoreductase [Pedobacter psychrotolerans]TCO25352.1 NAD(P)-dependent dehydrogenase (short-subunit alcohol dehydrogenase family) [Pedobacter psychrotolerans]GGE46177.1 short-chain dehydrogenase [Pedobacter psychrotolerans]